MAIKTDNTAISVDFVYVDEITNEEFKIRLHCTETYGRTFSVSGNIGGFTDGNSQYLCLPAELLVEAVDFARKNRYIEKTSVETPPQQPQPVSKKASPANGMFVISKNVNARGKTETNILPSPDLGGGKVQQIEQEEEDQPIEEVIFKNTKIPLIPEEVLKSKPIHKLTSSDDDVSDVVIGRKKANTLLPTEDIVSSYNEDQDIPMPQDEDEEESDEGVELIDERSDEDEMAKRVKMMASERAAAKEKAVVPKKKVKKTRHEDIKNKIRKQLEADDDIPEAEE